MRKSSGRRLGQLLCEQSRHRRALGNFNMAGIASAVVVDGENSHTDPPGKRGWGKTKRETVVTTGSESSPLQAHSGRWRSAAIAAGRSRRVTRSPKVANGRLTAWSWRSDRLRRLSVRRGRCQIVAQEGQVFAGKLGHMCTIVMGISLPAIAAGALGKGFQLIWTG